MKPLDPDDPPGWAFESVHLSAYDPCWPDRAAGYADELQPVLVQWLLAPIEHVGSTSIPDIVAEQTAARLDGMNWRYVPPDLDGRPWRRFFAKVSLDDQHRQAHLHLMSVGAARWDQQIRFRDALRASPELRSEYAAIKSQLATAYPDDRERYTDEKAVFVTRVMRDLDAAG